MTALSNCSQLLSTCRPLSQLCRYSANDEDEQPQCSRLCSSSPFVCDRSPASSSVTQNFRSQRYADTLDTRMPRTLPPPTALPLLQLLSLAAFARTAVHPLSLSGCFLLVVWLCCSHRNFIRCEPGMEKTSEQPEVPSLSSANGTSFQPCFAHSAS